MKPLKPKSGVRKEADSKNQNGHIHRDLGTLEVNFALCRVLRGGLKAPSSFNILYYDGRGEA